MNDGCRHGVGSITKELTMCDLKTSKRRGLVNKAKSWLRRPGTFKTASFVLNIVSLVVRVLDYFK